MIIFHIPGLSFCFLFFSHLQDRRTFFSCSAHPARPLRSHPVYPLSGLTVCRAASKVAKKTKRASLAHALRVISQQCKNNVLLGQMCEKSGKECSSSLITSLKMDERRTCASAQEMAGGKRGSSVSLWGELHHGYCWLWDHREAGGRVGLMVYRR